MKGLGIGYFADKVIVGFGLASGILIVLNGLFSSYEVIMRYFFNSPTVWVLEITIYLVIASTFFALAYALLQKAHVKVDFITNYLTPRTSGNIRSLHLCSRYIVLAGARLGKRQDNVWCLPSVGSLANRLKGAHVHSEPVHSDREPLTDCSVHQTFLGSHSRVNPFPVQRCEQF